jgi:putative ABC transport system permease protein
MIGHHLRIALRQFLRNGVWATLTVAGLAISIASCLLIFLYVQEERAYDRFHENGDRLHRVDKVVTPRTGGTERHAITSGPMGPAMATDYPEVETAVRVLPWFDDVLARHDDASVKFEHFVFVDSTFFEVFTFDLVSGDPATVLDAPLSAVLTESAARQLFGASDPVGREFTGLNDLSFRVTGIAADPPALSHLPYDVLVSYSSLEPGRGGLEMGWIASWYPQALFTYLLLRPDASASGLEAKLPDFMERHFPDRSDQYALYLQPLPDIYLGSSDLQYTGRTRSGNRTYVRILSLTALLILVIAAINFVNMGTARATRRAREVGVRKAVGAARADLVRQFLGENLVVATLALAVAVALIALALPYYRSFSGATLALGVWTNPSLVVMLVLVWLVVGLGAGAYPALHLSRLRGAEALRGGRSGAAFGGRMRRGLVSVQFTISIALIAGAVLVYRQTAFMQSKDLGFDREQIVVLETGDTAIADRMGAFRRALEGHPSVTGTAGSNSVPGLTMMSFGINPEGKAQDETWTSAAIRLDDFELLDLYGMEMATGRWFSEARPADRTGAIVINQALARSLGWSDDEAVGRRLDAPGEVDGGTVIGVVRDFHYESLRRPIEPIFFYFAPRDAMLSVKVRADEVAAALAHLRSTWEAFDPAYPFEYTFLDEGFARLYAAERNLMKALGLFGGLAVLVACLGLLGLAAFAAEQRTKEIGIRKVLGASVPGLVRLLSAEVFRLVLIAGLVAVPFAWLMGDRWLSGFAFRVGGIGWVVAGAGSATLLLALATVAWQAWKAATSDPVKSLRYE